MNWFKKHKKASEFLMENMGNSQKNIQLSFDLDQIPNEALNIIYNKKMNEYNKSIEINDGNSEKLQKELTIISEYLRQNIEEPNPNEPLYQYFITKGVPREALLKNTTEQLNLLKDSMERTQTALEALTPQSTPAQFKPSEELLFSGKIETPTSINQDLLKSDTHVKVEDEESIIEKFKNSGFKKLLHKDESESEDQPSDILEDSFSTLQKQAEKIVTMIKKEKPVEMNVDTELTKKRLELLDVEKDEFLRLQEPAVSTPPPTSFWKKKKKITPGLPDKPLRKKHTKEQGELLCTDCTHPMKAHSNGCKMCGCMNSMEEINEQHIVKPVVKIEEPQLPIQESDGLHNKLTVEEEIDVTKKLLEQAEKIQKPKPTKPTEKTEKEQQCTCDHYFTQHYEGRFCFECNCSKFTNYPNDQKA